MAENKNDVRDTYTIYDDQSIGKVQIADEVVPRKWKVWHPWQAT